MRRMSTQSRDRCANIHAPRPPLGTLLLLLTVSIGAYGVTGTVSSTDGTPLADTFVGVINQAGEALLTTTTGPDGSFTVDIDVTADDAVVVRPTAEVNSAGYDTYFYAPHAYKLLPGEELHAQLPPVGALVLLAFDGNGDILRWGEFEGLGTLGGQFVFATNIDGESVPASYFAIHDDYSRGLGSAQDDGFPAVLVQPGVPHAVYAMFWETTYGKLMIVADNAGLGFTVPTSGETVVIELNVEMARSAVSRLMERLPRYSAGAPAQVPALQQELTTALGLPTAAARAGAADEVLVAALALEDDLELEYADDHIGEVRMGTLSLRVYGGRPWKSVLASANRPDPGYPRSACERV